MFSILTSLFPSPINVCPLIPPWNSTAVLTAFAKLSLANTSLILTPSFDFIFAYLDLSNSFSSLLTNKAELTNPIPY